MAAPVVASSASVVAQFSTITVTKPSGTVSGDVLYAHLVAYDDASITITSAPSGWSLVAGPHRVTSGNITTAWVYRKVAGGSEPANYAWTTSTSNYTDAAILRITGADTTTPEDGTPSGNSGTGTTRTGLSITTTGTDRLLLLFSAGWGSAPTSTPSGMTEVLILDSVTGYYSQTLAAAGATGDKTHTQSSDAWVTHMLAVASPGSAGYTLTAASAAYATTASAVTFKRALRLVAGSAAYAYSASAVTFLRGKRLTADSAAYAVSASAVTLRVARKLVAASAAYTWSASAATLTRGRVMVADAAAFVATGSAVTFRRTYRMVADAAAYVWSPSAVTFTVGTLPEGIFAPPLSSSTLSAGALTGATLSAGALSATTLSAPPLP